MPLEFSSVTISFFVHSTEDEEWLKLAVCNSLGLLPEEMVSDKVTGHFGNEIVSVRAHIAGERGQEVCLKILKGLSPSSRMTLLSELDKSVDEHDALYLRIDRQEIDRQIVLTQEEPIRIKMKPRSRSGGHLAMIQSYKKMIA